jgi:hypothetical protein
MTMEQVDAMPMYYGCIRLGALSPDHVNLSMAAEDVTRFSGMKRWKKKHTGPIEIPA